MQQAKNVVNLLWTKATGAALFEDKPIVLNVLDSDEAKAYLEDYVKNNNNLLQDAAASALEISRLMRKNTLSLHGSFVSEEKGSEGMVDYNAMQASEEFKEYVLTTTLLTKLNIAGLANLAPETRIAFFLNIYNSLILHSTAVLQPADLPAKFALYSQASYQFGSGDEKIILTLDDIEHGILRGNRSKPSAKQPLFGERDVRRSLSVADDKVDARIHFALNCGAKSCPRIRVYSSDKLESELEMAAKTFCGAEVSIQDDDTISLSKIFLWYGSDFGDDDKAKLATISKWLPQPTQDKLMALVQQDKIKIDFRAYDWGLNSTKK